MAVTYLSGGAILYVHERVLSEFGGAGGIRDEGALASAIERPRATFAGQELYPTLYEKAAALLESLCANHPFVDGNKRVAYVSAALFLEQDRWTLKAEEDDGVSFMLDVAAGRLGKEEIRIWIEAHAVPVGSP